jgi:hypothetical protein
MFRRVLALAALTVLVATAAFAQLRPPFLISTQVSGTVFLTLDAVQAQVDAVMSHAAASKGAIASALAQKPLLPLPSTAIPRR